MSQPTADASTIRGRRINAGVRFCLLIACVALAACSNHASPPANPTATTRAPESLHAFVSQDWSFRIDVPLGWTVRHDFQPRYLANDAWKTFAAPDSQGQPVLSLTVPGSNRISDAEIRIGASRAAKEVQGCTTPPPSVRSGSVAAQRINGIDFSTFEAGDAAMSHHLRVHAYRVVHDGACYAIDLLVFGANPEVYDPPATPPFSDAQAFARMHAVFDSFRFLPQR